MYARMRKLMMLAATMICLAVWWVPAAIGQPANDDCTSVTPVALAAGGTVVFTGDNTGATNDCAVLAPFGEVWIAFTTTECVNLRLDFCATDPDFSPGWGTLFDDCPCADFENFDGLETYYCSNGNLSLYWLDVPAGTYWYPVSTPVGNEGPYTIRVYADACDGPWNDRCEDVTPVALAPGDTLVVDSDNTGAFKDCFEHGGDAETWVAFSIAECAHVVIDFCGTSPYMWWRFIGVDTACPCSGDLIGDTGFVDGGYCRDHFNGGQFWSDLPPGEYWYPISAMPVDQHPYTCRVHAYSCTATGACCLGDGTCLPDLTLLDCIDYPAEGVWQGAGTECEPNPCRPWYCNAYGSCDTHGGQYISRVQVGDIDQSSVCDSYNDFTHLSTAMRPRAGYAITVTNGDPQAGDQCGLWADWNQDGDFDDPEETITVNGSPGTGPYTAVITPPPAAVEGDTHLRVVLAGTADPLGPCEDMAYYGEVEDYTITVLPPPWDELEKLVASDGAEVDRFGQSVAVSGRTAVVGAHRDDDNGVNSGSAYVYVWDGSHWVQRAKLLASDGAAFDQFGEVVAISGDTVVVGASCDDDNGEESGSAYVFVRPGGGWSGTLNEDAKLLASDGAANDYFAASVAICGDAVVVGAPHDSGNDSGSAYVFVRPGGGWAGTLSEDAKLLASDAAAADYLGASVAVSGDSVVAGAWGDNDSGYDSGSAYVFVKPGAGWSGTLSEDAKLLASDGALSDLFAASVAISGDTVVIGAHADDDNGTDSGSAYVFVKPGAGWSGTLNQDAKLLASDGAASDLFGRSVSIAGNSIVAAADHDDDGGSSSGSAYKFDRPALGWSGTLREDAKLLPSDGAASDLFGWSVAMSVETILIGAFGDDDSGTDSGSAYVFGYPTGDLGCDGLVNGFDIDPFVLALTDPAGYAAAYPDCDCMLADVNDDGVVNAFDIDPFVDLLTGP